MRRFHFLALAAILSVTPTLAAPPEVKPEAKPEAKPVYKDGDKIDGKGFVYAVDPDDSELRVIIRTEHYFVELYPDVKVKQGDKVKFTGKVLYTAWREDPRKYVIRGVKVTKE